MENIQERRGGSWKQIWRALEGKYIKYFQLILFHFETIPNPQKICKHQAKLFFYESFYSNLLAWCSITPKYWCVFFTNRDIFLYNHQTVSNIRKVHRYVTNIYSSDPFGFTNCSGSFLNSKATSPGSCVAFSSHVSLVPASGKFPPSFPNFHILNVFDDYKPVIL